MESRCSGVSSVPCGDSPLCRNPAVSTSQADDSWIGQSLACGSEFCTKDDLPASKLGSQAASMRSWHFVDIEMDVRFNHEHMRVGRWKWQSKKHIVGSHAEPSRQTSPMRLIFNRCISQINCNVLRATPTPKRPEETSTLDMVEAEERDGACSFP